MKILHLRLENFRGIRELDIDFDGKNADIFGANGTGKTTIANAITWLFCDAPATEEKDFSPKTAGAHDLHHKAEMTVEKDDGERFTFAKDFYEKWTKKRGSASRDFSGHVTDLYVNGVQQKKKTYEETIRQATGATIEQMKMLLIHGYFPQTMKPEARRTVLFELCEEVSDEDVIRENGLEGLSGVLLRPGTTDEHYSVDEYKKVAAAQRRKLNKELDTLPARIDEASKALPEDGRELAAIEADLKTGKEALDQAMAATADAKHPEGAEVAKAVLAGKEAELKAKQAAYDAEMAKKNADAYDAVSQAKRERDERERAATKAAEEAKRVRETITALKAKRDALLEEYAEVQAEIWSEAQEFCPTCGQHLPDGKIAEFRQIFNERKSARKQHINTVVTERAHEVKTGIKRAVATAPIVPPGAMVRHVAFGVGQVIGLMASFPGCQAKTMELPYLRGLPDEVSMESDGKTLHHERFGKGSVYAYIVVFKQWIMPMSYPSSFSDKSMFIE